MELLNYDLVVMGNTCLKFFNLIRHMVWQPELFNFFYMGYLFIYLFIEKGSLGYAWMGLGVDE